MLRHFGNLLFIFAVIISNSACSIISYNEGMKVNNIFSDNMVLQRDMKVPVWGKDNPGKKITVSIQDQIAEGASNEDGNWKVYLNNLKSGGPFEMRISGSSTVVLKNVMVGEVWLASGQSNMEWPVKLSNDADKEIKSANFPDIRLITVPHSSSKDKLTDIKLNGWHICKPETISDFSAAAYFFGRSLHKKYNVPVGLINCSWGGTPMESWTPYEALAGNKNFSDVLANYSKWFESVSSPDYAENYNKARKAWSEQTGGEEMHTDPGDDRFEKGWAKIDFDDSKWKDMKLPNQWEGQGLDNLDGAVWFRKEVKIPDQMKGKDLLLSLGIIDDFDKTFFNGEKVGETGPENLNAWSTPRNYKIPASLIKEKNVITVRVFDHYISGGFLSEGAKLFIVPADAQNPDISPDRISLAGNWKYEVSIPLIQKPVDYRDTSGVLSVLYNGMISPVIPYGIKGAIWYQGESNAGRAERYRELSEIMISSWRKLWGEGEFPFICVQLAGFGNDIPGWPELREAQEETLEIPKVGMASAVDIGEQNDIHPKNKQEVGERLALAARAIAYGEKIEYLGPIFKEAKFYEKEAEIFFSHADKGLTTRNDEKPRGFEIAGSDGKYYPAAAEISDGKIIVSSPEVSHPVSVRYGWHSYMDINLYNKELLPASPFRTDKTK